MGDDSNCVSSLESQVHCSEAPGSFEVSDKELVAAILRKDRKATAEFVGRYSDSVYRFVRSRLAPRTDLTDDLVQEVFLTAWQQFGSFRAESSLYTWLMAIARHKVQDYYRALLRQPDPIEDWEETPAVLLGPQLDVIRSCLQVLSCFCPLFKPAGSAVGANQASARW